ERVQVFTNPLWMFTLSSAYYFVRDIYAVSISVSIFLTLTTVGTVAYLGARSPLGAILAITMLTASKAFVDYSTSGLENPLTHVLVALFLLVFQANARKKITVRGLFALSFLAALGTLNRMDTILIFL